MAKRTKREFTEPLWERQPGETAAAFRAFCKYRDAGGDRSLRALAGTPKGTQKDPKRRHHSAWSREWGWVERAAAFDDRMDRIATEAIGEQRKQAAVAWSERREEDRESAWQLGDRIVKELMRMLDDPPQPDPDKPPVRLGLRDYKNLLDGLIRAFNLKGSAILDALYDVGTASSGDGQGTGKTYRVSDETDPDAAAKCRALAAKGLAGAGGQA